MGSSSKTSSLKRLFSLLKPYKGIFAAGMVALTVGSGVNLLFPEVVRRVLSDEYRQMLTDRPWFVASVFLGLMVVQGIGFYFRSLLFGVIGQKVVADLRKQLSSSLIAQEIAYFDTARTGDLVSRMSADTQLMQTAVSMTLSVLIRYTVQVVIGVVLMAWISLRLSALLLLTMPLLLVVGKVLGTRLRRASKAQQEALGLATTILEEAVGGIRLVKAFSYEKTIAGRFEKATNEVVERGIERATIAAGFSSFANFLMNAAIVVVLFYGITQISTGALALPDLAAFLLYGAIVGVSFTFLSGAYTDMVQANAAAERVFEIVDRIPTVRAPEVPKEIPQKNGVSLSFKNVSFAYPTRADKEVLSDINFTINPGKSVALVGPSGSGKSTIVALTFRWYDPVRGIVEINGVDIRSLTQSDASGIMALVPQDAHVFAASVLDNVRVGNSAATEAQVQAALEAAYLGDVVRSMAKGIHTEIGERGVQLSGGQRQRLAIARAIVRNPQLLVLDEATSALDSESEHAVQEALKALMKGRSTLMIAHRLSTVIHADEILVIEKGRIIERGAHQQLLAQGGLYRSLVDRQDLMPENTNGRTHTHS